MNLSLIRKEIAEIDEKIITLIAQRFRLLPEIIEEKEKEKLRAFQPEREQQLQIMYYNLAIKNDLDPNLIQTIFALIVKEMREAQEKSLKPTD
jgi:chorismate mutase